MAATPARSAAIPALVPRGAGHQFVLYGDSCSGVPGGRHEQAFARVNAVVRRLAPGPQFLVFAGDEVAGLTPEPRALRAQWRHWLDVEMGWRDRRVPLWHATGNHTTYDAMSADTFRALTRLPRNGPRGQQGLAYWIRRGDLLLIFVHTLCAELGGEGYVETAWLRATLRAHADARHKLVVGHHPAFPVNGYSGAYQRQIAPEAVGAFWDVLVEQGVAAYLCSHILAFDVQVHRGVLQVCTAGAGTAPRMPAGVEYLHCVQMALDGAGLRYQVLDAAGRVRERLSWPPAAPGVGDWTALPRGRIRAPTAFPHARARCIALRFRGRAAKAGTGAMQTLLAAQRTGELAALWIGLRGNAQRLTVVVSSEPGRSPHYWLGPQLAAGEIFDLALLLHADMGPGGILWRRATDGAWQSCAAASAWGLERLRPAAVWSIGHDGGGPRHSPFRGEELAAAVAAIWRPR